MGSEVVQFTPIALAATHPGEELWKPEQRIWFFKQWKANTREDRDATCDEMRTFNGMSLELVRWSLVLRLSTIPRNFSTVH